MKSVQKTNEKKKDKEDKPKTKSYYDVVVETISPITVKYRVFAFDAKEAAELAEKGRATIVSVSKPKIVQKRINSVVVYIAGTVMRLLSYRK